MGYIKKVWVDDITPVSATNLNNIENGISVVDTHMTAIASASVLGHIKVGTGINVAAGVISVPAAAPPVVLAPLTIYVDKLGSNSNTGLSAGASGAFLTIQAAVNKAKTLICSEITISIAPGTYVENLDMQFIANKVIMTSSTFTKTDVTITGYINGNNSLFIRIMNLTMNGTLYGFMATLRIGRAEFYNVVMLNMTVNPITIKRASSVIIQNCTLSHASIGTTVDLAQVGCVFIENGTLTGGYAIQLENVGSARFENVTLVVTVNPGNAGINLTSGTTASMANMKGTLGAYPVAKVSGSVLMKGVNTITGAADIKSGGGQIFV